MISILKRARTHFFTQLNGFKYFNLIRMILIIICLHTVKCFQVLLFYTNNSMLPFWVRVDLGAMAMNGYSAFPKAPALLKLHHQIV